MLEIRREDAFHPDEMGLPYIYVRGTYTLQDPFTYMYIDVQAFHVRTRIKGHVYGRIWACIRAYISLGGGGAGGYMPAP